MMMIIIVVMIVIMIIIIIIVIVMMMIIMNMMIWYEKMLRGSKHHTQEGETRDQREKVGGGGGGEPDGRTKRDMEYAGEKTERERKRASHRIASSRRAAPPHDGWMGYMYAGSTTGANTNETKDEGMHVLVGRGMFCDDPICPVCQSVCHSTIFAHTKRSIYVLKRLRIRISK